MNDLVQVSRPNTVDQPSVQVAANVEVSARPHAVCTIGLGMTEAIRGIIGHSPRTKSRSGR